LADPTIKIAYSAAQARARGEFMLGECKNDCPNGFWPRVKAKLDSEVAAGRIAEYALHEAEFSECWQAGKDALARGESADTLISLTLGQGWPKIAGIEVFVIAGSQHAFELSVKIPAGQARKMQFEWFEAAVLAQARSKGYSGTVHSAQVRGVWHRVLLGHQTTDRECILPRPKANPEKPFQMVSNSTRGEVVAIISDIKLIRSAKVHEQISKVCSDSIEKIKQTSGRDYNFLRNELGAYLTAAISGPERLGLSMPLVCLVGVAEVTAPTAAANTPKIPSAQSRNLIKENYPGKGKLPIDISADRMEATIGRWPMEIYNDRSFAVSVDWIEKELKNFGVIYGYAEHVKKLKEAISKGKDLTDRPLASGTHGSVGSEPYLHPVFREAVKPKSGESINDIRNSQQREIVKEGDLVAEIRFATGGANGKDVFGNEVLPAAPTDLAVDVGDGIRREGMQFFATKEGMPQIDGLHISLSEGLVLNEDVNLRTGNVYFKGNVEINGSIDDGATAEVAGDLIVRGTIRGAFVRVGGRLVVEQGINTAGRGMVRCRSDIEAGFVENSKVACGGNLNVDRVIMNSYVVAGGGIVLNPEGGVIAGGMISARMLIRTGKLGLPKGARTEVNVGVDWRAEFSMQVRQQRLKRLNERLEQIRQELREVVRKKKMQKSPKLEEQSVQMTDFLQRGRLLVEKIESSMAIAQSRIVYDPEAKIFVHDVLSANCNITCGGQKVAVLKEVAGVEISSRRRHGQFVSPLEEDSGKKAS
jgi:uncharacterized protein (DUF342 family)